MTPDNPQSTPSPEPFRIELIEANSKLARCERDLAAAQQDLLLKSQGIDAWREEAHKREAQLAAANAEIARLKGELDTALAQNIDGDAERKVTDMLRAEVERLTKERDEFKSELQKVCEHDWIHIDDSFDHEFGTEQLHSCLCEKCGATKPYEPETFGDEAI